jgi:phage baseplate assembly protein W
MVIKALTPLKRRLSLYSDFHKDLTVSPISNDLAVKRDEAAVKEAMKNLILTDRGERLFQPFLGGDIRSMLFEQMTPATLKLLEEKVKEVINNHEPRVELIRVEVLGDYDKNGVYVNIYFFLRNYEEELSLTVFLERVR